MLSTSLGGRDSDAKSLAIGDTMVLSNTMVNNVRFTYHYTNVHRTHTPYFGPEDVGIKIYSYVDDVTLYRSPTHSTSGSAPSSMRTTVRTPMRFPTT
jgi:hypothetical protein